MSVNNDQQDLNAINDARQVLVSTEKAEAQLSNLGLTDEELDGIKGGPGGNGGGGRTGGDWIMNHNETTLSDGDDKAQLAVLPVTTDQEAQVMGGRPWTLHKGIDNPDLIVP